MTIDRPDQLLQLDHATIGRHRRLWTGRPGIRAQPPFGRPLQEACSDAWISAVPPLRNGNFHHDPQEVVVLCSNS